MTDNHDDHSPSSTSPEASTKEYRANTNLELISEYLSRTLVIVGGLSLSSVGLFIVDGWRIFSEYRYTIGGLFIGVGLRVAFSSMSSLLTEFYAQDDDVIEAPPGISSPHSTPPSS